MMNSEKQLCDVRKVQQHTHQHDKPSYNSCAKFTSQTICRQKLGEVPQDLLVSWNLNPYDRSLIEKANRMEYHQWSQVAELAKLAQSKQAREELERMRKFYFHKDEGDFI